jgi:hypothetical protein
MITGAILPAGSIYAQFGSIAEGVCRADRDAFPHRQDPCAVTKGLFLRMPGRSAANRMHQCANAKTVTTSLFPGRSPVRTGKETLQVRYSPPTHQIRDAMAAAGFTAHSLQVMHRKRAAPRCPSTQPAAGAKSPCGRLLASERMLDDRVGAGRAGFVAHTSCQRCVSHCSCSRPFVGCHRMRTCVHCKLRNHGRTTRQRMSLRAGTYSGSTFTQPYRTAR